MTLKIKYFVAVLSISALTGFLNSCKKEQPSCSGNCTNINFTGSVYLKTDGTALANVPVEVNWVRKQNCIGCISYKVASVKSASDGKFNFNTTIDTTFFNDYFLSVRVPIYPNYISSSSTGGANFNELRFYNFSLSGFQNIKFEFYPKTFLTIKLHRIQNDNFDYFSVNHNFTNDFQYVDFIIAGQQFATDTTFKVETSSNISTRIIWKKTIISGQSTQFIDSLICTSNGTNVFNINY